MQTSTLIALAAFGVFGPAMAATVSANVTVHLKSGCPNAGSGAAFLQDASSFVSCGSTFGAGSASVSGSGCSTFFFTDGNCQNNFFGAGNKVPNSACYNGVGSFKIQC